MKNIDIQIILPEEAKVLRETITAELPEYFGLPEVNVHYAEGMLNRLSIAAFLDQSAVGLLTLEFPYPNNANIYWMGIRAAYHRQGIGKAMIRFAMALAASKGAQSLTVETLSPSECDENYIKTYRFYETCGFKSLFDLKPAGYQYNMVYMGKFIHQPAVGLLSHHPFKIKSLAKEDIPQIVAAFTDIQWDKPASLFEKYLDEQSQKERCVWLVFSTDHQFAGYITLKWRSDYKLFQEQNIPEIMDLNVLNVLPVFRNQGIGSYLLDIAEQAAGQKTHIVGLGVGLYKDYGAAQRLYVKKGYIPDAQGLTYAYQPIKPGSRVYLDDDLVLWFTKKLGNSLLIPTQLLAQKQ